ncbi:hypothetical protein [Planococcus halotolerans]|uniref:Integrase catalytic domain-containing protein n=1 Tax=Planococcus halotolerans TaxID=2233542 RepID=A0A365KL57_9BACL|nr:hypothetical protein [Planococcus halotolerans]RAZ73473.1 hypothetical protein DP120_17225 [Planococcus halotolerans]
MLKELKAALDGNIHPEAMIHSDQGFHYTHPEYHQRVKEMGLAQSISRRATASTTPPFNHFLVTSKMMSIINKQQFGELQGLVDDYMEHYKRTRK